MLLNYEVLYIAYTLYRSHHQGKYTREVHENNVSPLMWHRKWSSEVKAVIEFPAWDPFPPNPASSSCWLIWLDLCQKWAYMILICQRCSQSLWELLWCILPSRVVLLLDESIESIPTGNSTNKRNPVLKLRELNCVQSVKSAHSIEGTMAVHGTQSAFLHAFYFSK